jgi:hypothetical protein
MKDHKEYLQNLIAITAMLSSQDPAFALLIAKCVDHLNSWSGHCPECDRERNTGDIPREEKELMDRHRAERQQAFNKPGERLRISEFGSGPCGVLACKLEGKRSCKRLREADRAFAPMSNLQFDIMYAEESGRPYEIDHDNFRVVYTDRADKIDT